MEQAVAHLRLIVGADMLGLACATFLREEERSDPHILHVGTGALLEQAGLSGLPSGTNKGIALAQVVPTRCSLDR